jgi:hypothetical protein
MIEFILLRTSHNEFRRRRFPDRRVFTGLPVPRGILFPYEPTGLMREPVGSPGEDRPALIPIPLIKELSLKYRGKVGKLVVQPLSYRHSMSGIEEQYSAMVEQFVGQDGRAPSKFGSWKPGYFFFWAERPRVVTVVLFLTVLVPLALAVLVLLVTVVVLLVLLGVGCAYMETAPKVRAAAAISVISFFIWRFSFGLRSFKIVWANHSEPHMKDLLIGN